MGARDWLAAFAAMCIFCLFAPLLLLFVIFCEESPEDNYKHQNW